MTDPDDIKGRSGRCREGHQYHPYRRSDGKIVSLMENISQYDYDVKALKKTLENLEGKDEGFFAGLWSSIKGFFTGDSGDGGIINDTKDDISRRRCCNRQHAGCHQFADRKKGSTLGQNRRFFKDLFRRQR